MYSDVHGRRRRRGKNRKQKMKITSMKIKLFGKVATMYRVLDEKGGVLQVLETKEEAEAWIAAQ